MPGSSRRRTKAARLSPLSRLIERQLTGKKKPTWHIRTRKKKNDERKQSGTISKAMNGLKKKKRKGAEEGRRNMKALAYRQVLMAVPFHPAADWQRGFSACRQTRTSDGAPGAVLPFSHRCRSISPSLGGLQILSSLLKWLRWNRRDHKSKLDESSQATTPTPRCR